MSTQFHCEAGHSWDADGAPATACPVCGGSAQAAQPDTIKLPSDNGITPQTEETLWKNLTSDPVIFDSDPELRLPTKPADQFAAAQKAGSGAADHPLLPGYEILDELGRGGMGVVYKAVQIGLKRLVALKMILAGPHAGTEDRERFLTEAEAAARLQHANIVQIYDIGEHEGRAYFALEFVEGGSLDQWIDGKPQPPRAAARLVELLARAMHYAHERGIVHRDLKPANILLANRDPGVGDQELKPESRIPLADRLTPKITDFGLAKKLDSDDGQTRTGSILGTPNYMAPEQATGQTHAIGPCSDIHALGAILYELLTGRPPFMGESAYDTIRQVANAEPLPPRSLVAGLPRDIETVCLKCLHKDPRRRYSDAQELARDLRRYQDGESIRARPTPAWERAVKWTRRRPGAAAFLAAGTALLLLLLGIGVAWNARLRLESEREKQRSEELSSALDVSERRLLRLTMANGNRLMDSGDYIDALPWFVEAMRMERNLDERMQSHRLRIAALLEHCPQAANVWFHASGVNSLAFSPDGRLLVYAGDDGTAVIRDVETGLAAPAVPRHDKPIRRAAFSPDSSLVVTASADAAARLWRSDSGLPFGEPMKHGAEVVSAVFSPDGALLLTACRDGSARIWDTATQQPKPIPVRHEAPLTQALFSPDGGRVLTAAEDGTVHQWNAETGVELAHPQRQRAGLVRIAYSHDGKRFLTGSADGTARAWHSDSGLPASPPMRHAGVVLHVEFSPDDRLIATSGADHAARVWNASNGQAIGVPLRHGSNVFAAVFGPSSRRVLTVSDDNSARIWEASNGEPLVPPLKHNGSVVFGALSPDGRWAATGGRDGMVRLWTTTASRHHMPLLRHQGRVTSVAYSASGRFVATAGEDGMARVWDGRSGEPVSHPLRHPGAVTRIAFSPDEKLLLTADQNGTARLWKVESGEPTGQLYVHGYSLKDTAFRPDGKQFVTAGEDGTARIWDIASGTLAIPALQHGGIVFSAVFSPDGKQIVTASADGVARQWDAETGTILHEFKHVGGVNHAVFSFDGRRIATAGVDHTARIWDAENGKQIGSPLRHGSAVLHVAFSRQGTLVTSSDDNTARVWTASEEPAQTPPLRHMGTVDRAGFSPDGSLVVTAGNDGVARVWDAATGEPITPPLQHRGPVTDAAFSPLGNHLVTAGPSAARLWRLAAEDRPLDELEHVAQFLAVARIDETGSMVPLHRDRVLEIRQMLHEKQVALMESSEKDLLDRRRREVEECEMCGDWHGAEWNLDKLLAARPNDPQLLRRRGDARVGMGDLQRALTDYNHAAEGAPDDWDIRLHRGRVHARLRQWQRAAADFARNRDIGPDDPRVWREYAVACLAADDEPAYRIACADLMRRFFGAADVETARLAIWTATLAPRAVSNPNRLVAEAERTFRARPRNAVHRLTLAAALLRAGKPAGAIQHLESVLPDARDRTAHALLLLTLGQQQAGKLEEARQNLDRAVEALEESARESDQPAAWVRAAELELLRSEAERFFKQGKQ
jgi:WD40 repeat protein/serine/threonine protein kinase/tetratricopeptide (TPR) repeat protein